VEMCPPIPSSLRLASETITAEFQRIEFWISLSVSRSPGYGGCWSQDMVLT